MGLDQDLGLNHPATHVPFRETHGTEKCGFGVIGPWWHPLSPSTSRISIFLILTLQGIPATYIVFDNKRLYVNTVDDMNDH